MLALGTVVVYHDPVVGDIPAWVIANSDTWNASPWQQENIAEIRPGSVNLCGWWPDGTALYAPQVYEGTSGQQYSLPV